MSRGIMYHANESGLDLGEFCEDDLYEDLDVLHCDFVKQQDSEDAADSIDGLIHSLQNAFGPYIKTEGLPEHCAFTLTTPDTKELDAAKCAYFQPYLDAMKKEAAEMTITRFINSASLCTLEMNIDDRYDDAVYLDLGNGPATYTMMGFIRRLLPQTTYHFSDITVLMH